MNNNLKENAMTLVKNPFFIGALTTILFELASVLILRLEFNPIEAIVAAIAYIMSAKAWAETKDYLDPRFHYPVLLFLFYWLGNFDFLGMYEKIPISMWVIYLFGMLGLQVGFAISNNKCSINERNSGYSRYASTSNDEDNSLTAVLHIALFLALTAKIYMYYINGVPALSNNVDLVREAASESFGWIKVLTTLLNILPPLLFYNYLRTKRVLNLIEMGICYVPLFLDTSRLPILQAAAMTVLIYLINIKRIKLRYIILIILVGLLGISIVKFTRNILSYPGYLQSIASTRSTNLFENILLSGFDSFRVGIDGLRKLVEIVPSESSHTYGKMAINSILSVLPGEQETMGFYVSRLFEQSFDGIGTATTLYGMMYLDFGYFGVLLGMLILGSVIVINYKHNIQNSRVTLKNIYSIYIIYYSIVALRTGFLPNIEPILTLVQLIGIAFIVRLATRAKWEVK